MGEQRGFTLMELMIAVVIVGILAAIAFPSYTKQLVKGNRSAAEAMLMDVAQKEQQYLLDARSYTSATSCSALSTALGINVDPAVMANYTCTVTATAGPPPTFIATAHPTSSRQASDGDLTINNAGQKTPTDKW